MAAVKGKCSITKRLTTTRRLTIRFRVEHNTFVNRTTEHLTARLRFETDFDLGDSLVCVMPGGLQR